MRTLAMVGLVALASLNLALAPTPSDPYLVATVVHDRTTDPWLLMEIWSDRTTVIRPVGPNDVTDHICGPAALCTSNENHCRSLAAPSTGKTCNYCVMAAGAWNAAACWDYTGQSCTKLPGTGGGTPTQTACGAEWVATCAGTNGAYCTGGAPAATGNNCNLWKCVP